MPRSIIPSLDGQSPYTHDSTCWVFAEVSIQSDLDFVLIIVNALDFYFVHDYSRIHEMFLQTCSLLINSVR